MYLASCAVLDVVFSPFNDTRLYTGDEMGYIKVWDIPEDEMTENMGPDDAKAVLEGHLSSVRQLVPHPAAEGILFSGKFQL